MGEVVKIIRVDLAEHAGGLFCASSPDLPGMVVINRDIAKITADIPNVIKLVMKRGGRDVEVRSVAPNEERGPRRLIPDWAAIPVSPAERRVAAG